MGNIESTVRIEFEVEMVLEALRLCFEFCTLWPNTSKQFQGQQSYRYDCSKGSGLSPITFVSKVSEKTKFLYTQHTN